MKLTQPPHDFRFIYPPSINQKMDAKFLPFLNTEWWAQPMYRGTSAVLFINGTSDFKIFDRYGLPLSLTYAINFPKLNDSEKSMVLCGQYINTRREGENKDSFFGKFVIWDILIWCGEYLVDYAFRERCKILESLYNTSRGWVSPQALTLCNHLCVTNTQDVFLARTYADNFVNRFNSIIQTDLYGGMILKRADAKLEPGLKLQNNTSWQIEVPR